MARPPGPTCASAAERKSDIAAFRQQARAVDSCTTEVQIAMIAQFFTAVERPLGEEIAGGGPERFHMKAVAFRPFTHQPRSDAEAGTQGRRKGTRTQAALLPAAVDDGRQGHVVAQPERTEAHGSCGR